MQTEERPHGLPGGVMGSLDNDDLRALPARPSRYRALSTASGVLPETLGRGLDLSPYAQDILSENLSELRL